MMKSEEAAFFVAFVNFVAFVRNFPFLRRKLEGDEGSQKGHKVIGDCIPLNRKTSINLSRRR
jgi:hypothetical protein